jgi:hypothetical protein
MNEELKKIFKNLEGHSSSVELKAKILHSINAQEKRSIRAKIMLTYGGFMSSIALLIYAVFSFGQAFLQSEFWSLLSLGFSDAGTVAKYGGDFLFSLLETFPVSMAIIFLVPVFIMLISLASYFKLNNSNHYNHI